MTTTASNLADRLSSMSATIDIGLRLATVKAIGTGSNLTITLGGVDVPAIRLASYDPVVGDPVQVFQSGKELLVLGSKVRGQIIPDPPPPRDFTAEPIQNIEIAHDAVQTEQIADGAVARANIAVAAINDALIDVGAITETKISDDAITAPKISAGSILGEHISGRIIEGAHVVAGTLTANEIKAGTITAAEIAANTITANQIAANTITGDRIKANTITAGQIAASTLTAREMLIGNFVNLIQDPGAEFGNLTAVNAHSGLDRGKWSLADKTVTAQSTYVRSGRYAYMHEPINWTTAGSSVLYLNGTNDITRQPKVGAGEKYTFSVWALATGAGPWNRARMVIFWRAADNTNILTTTSWILQTAGTPAGQGTYQQYVVSATAPAGAAYVQPTIYIEPDGGTGVWVFDDLNLRQRIEGNLIVEGAITADSAIIANGAIKSAQIESLVASKISAGAMSVGSYIQSNVYTAPNGATAGSGWRISADGNATFNNVTVYGLLYGDIGGSSTVGGSLNVNSLIGFSRTATYPGAISSTYASAIGYYTNIGGGPAGLYYKDNPVSMAGHTHDTSHSHSVDTGGVHSLLSNTTAGTSSFVHNSSTYTVATSGETPETNGDTWNSTSTISVQGYTYSDSASGQIASHAHGLPYHKHTTASHSHTVPNHQHNINHKHVFTI